MLRVNYVRDKAIQGLAVANYYQVITQYGVVVLDGIGDYRVAKTMCNGLNQALVPVIAPLQCAAQLARDLLDDISKARVSEIIEVRKALDESLRSIDEAQAEAHDLRVVDMVMQR